MKVMFIDDTNVPCVAIVPKIGEIVTIDGNSYFYPNNYYIKEYFFDKKGNPQSFKKRRFIPLSDIDEKELIKERELVNA